MEQEQPMQQISENFKAVQQRIEAACRRAGRDPAVVTLITVSKTIDVDRINAAVAAGAATLGENRVQEVLAKRDAVSPEVRWHLIGHLQTNKVRQIIDKVDLIHSLDSLHLAEEIQKRAQLAGRTVDLLVEVNVGAEDSKFGLAPEAVRGFLESLQGMDRIRILGLMTVAPFLEDPESVRMVFRSLKGLFDELKDLKLPNVQMMHLSMGMTHDFEVAIEEGATMVRVGTGIFGARDYTA